MYDNTHEYKTICYETYDNICKKYINKFINNDNKILCENIFNLSLSILQEFNLESNNVGTIEIHETSSNDIINHIHNSFGVHKDNDNHICNTIIYYLYFEDTLKGGELVICDNDIPNISLNKIITKISPLSSNDENIKIVVLEGSVYHYVEDLSGIGKRVSVVVQCLKNN